MIGEHTHLLRRKLKTFLQAMDKKSLNLKVTSALLADDIRRESNGKLILVRRFIRAGISFTNPLPIRKNSLWALVLGKVAGEAFEFRFRLRNSEENETIVEGSTKIRLNEGVSQKLGGQELPIELILPLSPAEFRKDGNHIVQYSLNKGRWKNLMEFNVNSPEQSA